MPSFAVKAKETTYEIYPTPHDMSYQEDEFIIRAQVNVVYEDEIDAVTRNRMSEVLALKDKQVSVSDQWASNQTNVLVGTYQSGGYVDRYVQEHYDVDASLFDEFGAHFVAARDNEIVILGNDSDGAFYGITSLKHIFNQMDGSTIRNFEIRDYADTDIRGFIEGYYGIPWSNEDRMSLMKFGGDFKMTSYVFAPKNDPYHKEKWRDLYPEDEFAAIKEMVQVGINSKCRFVWTAHPFMGGFDASRVDEEIAALLNKFDQLYDAGVRQFGVLGDDVGSLDRNIVIKMMKAVSEWADAKGDVYDSVFCPAGYNHSWQGDYSELNDYDAGFPDNVKIFWTGEAVCQPVEQKTLDHFRRYNLPAGTQERRSPLFWLNWPVNDINGERLLMGKGSQLRTDIDPADLSGVVTNPMQEAEASKTALFAVSDYSWNVKDFDDDQSWADSFKYIDQEAAMELHTLAKHMSNPEPNGHGLVLAESEELQPLINTFQQKLASGASIKETGTQLMAEMDVIIDACIQFHKNSTNENLKDELLPFTGSLKDLTTAIKGFIQAAIAVEEADMLSAFGAYSSASSDLINSQKHVRKMLSGSAMVSPGSTHLIPLAEALQDNLSGPINDYVLSGEQPLVITASSNIPTWYEGKIENIIDGDQTTVAWHNGYEKTGLYYQVNLSKPTTIYGVHILNGTPAKPQDTFGYAKLQYSTDGENFLDLNDTVYGEYAVNVDVNDIAINDVVAVRYVCTKTSSGNKWPAMREFSVVTELAQKGSIYTNVDAYDSLDSVYETAYAAINPVQNITLQSGEYIGLKLDRIHDIRTLSSELSNDKLTLQISKNAYEWTNVNAGDIAQSARYIRILNKQNDTITFDLTKFSIDTNEITDKTVVDTNFGIETPQNVFDGDLTTATQYVGSQNKGMYFTYDLGQMIQLDSFKAICTDSEWDYPRHGKFSVSADGEEWTTIMTLGNQDEVNPGEAENTDEIGFVLPSHEISYNAKKVTDLNIQARYLKFEITKTKVGADKWVRFQELELNDGVYIPTENNPTYTSNTQETKNGYFRYMTDGNISTMFVPADTNSNVTYALSENNDVNAIKVIQNSSVISNAVVKARVYREAGGSEWITLGTLNQVINEFVLPADTILLDVNLEWGNVIPNIVELSTYKIEYGEVDKTALNQLINNPEDTTSWTSDSVKVYQDALVAGKGVQASEYASQENVNNAVQAMKHAIANAILKGDINKLTSLVAGAHQDEANYTASSWMNYVKAINAVKAAIETADQTSIADVEELTQRVLEAEQALIYNPSSQEEAVITLAAEKAFITAVTEPERMFTKVSWNTYTTAAADLQKLLDENETTAVHPERFAQTLTQMIDAKKSLVAVGALPQLIDEFMAIQDPSIYTEASFKAYEAAIAAGKAELENGNAETIATAIKEIETTKDALSLMEYTPEKIKNLLQQVKAMVEADYTTASYQRLKSVIAEVEVIDLDKASEEALKGYADKLNSAAAQLVSVKGLKTALTAAGQLDLNLYTSKSARALREAMDQAKTELENGTAESVKTAGDALDLSMKALVVRADADEVTAYINGITKLDLDKYTEESILAYQNAYAKLSELSQRLEDVSVAEYNDARINFEKAEAGLVEKNVSQPDPEAPQPGTSGSVSTGDQTNTLLYGLGLGLAVLLGTGVYLKKRKELCKESN